MNWRLRTAVMTVRAGSEVAFGDTPTSIGQGLQALGVIGDAGLFVDYARAEGLDTQFQAGIYFVRQTHPPHADRPPAYGRTREPHPVSYAGRTAA
ncbi:MAG: hypothetical protein HND48_07430 [Chloroflexi bacterium]|nr:hypothetical protein [Chloroflexota bacterium]